MASARPGFSRNVGARIATARCQTEIVKGCEFEKGRYVVLSEEDFDKVRPESTRVIDLVQFADDSAIDPMYVDRAYLPLVGTLTFDDEARQYLVAAILRPGNAAGTAAAVSLLHRLL